MVFHVGIDFRSGNVAAYNDVTKEIIKFNVVFSNIYGEIKQLDDLFKNIKSTLIGDLGYICFSMLKSSHFLLNDFRQVCIKKGEEYGFKKSLIINSVTKMYLDCLISLKERPKNGDIIWIFTLDKCVIWEKTDTKTKLIKILDDTFAVISENKLLEIKEDSDVDKNPNIIIFVHSDFTDFSEIVKYTFPDCKCVLHKSTFETCEIALVKARIGANDPNLDSDIKTCDIYNYIYGIIRVTLSSSPKPILNLEKGQLLPFEKSLTILVKNDENILEITCWIGYQLERIKIEVTPEMLTVGEISFFIKIDENGIFSHDYLVIKTVENTESRIKKIYENKIKSVNETYNIPKKELISNLNINAMGIDLGMTRCCVAVNRKDRFELVAIDNIEKQLPSYISFKEKEPICGQLVINQLQFYANSTVFDIKRLIGRNFDEIKINPAWHFEIIKSGSNKSFIRVQGYDGTVEKYPEDISAILLKHIKQKVEEFQGTEMDEVVITVPAGFNTNQKIATHVAAELAGFKTVHLLSEPIAASIAYFVDRPIPSNFNMLLFDLGGGTLDLCIFKVEKNKLKIIINDGDCNFGGRNFDEVLFKYFLKSLKTDYNVTVNEKIRFRLIQKCQEIKHTLSTEDEASLDISDFNLEIDEFLTITRQEFEKMSAPLLERIQEFLKQTFSKTDIFASDINKILLVGGGCRMPMIQLFLRQAFTLADHTCARNPDEMVAIGAAYYSSFIMSKNDSTGCNIM